MLNEANKKTNGELQENKDENPYAENADKEISNDLGERIRAVDEASLFSGGSFLHSSLQLLSRAIP